MGRPPDTLLEAAFSREKGEDQLTEILAFVLSQSPIALDHFVQLFEPGGFATRAGDVQTQREYRDSEGLEPTFRPDLLIGEFGGNDPAAGSGLAIEVKANPNTALTNSERKRWPRFGDNRPDADEPFRRGALVPAGYRFTACLEGTCRDQACSCEKVDPGEVEAKGFQVITWSQVRDGLTAAEKSLSRSESQWDWQLICELLGFLERSGGLNMDGPEGLTFQDIDLLPGAKRSLRKADDLFGALLGTLEDEEWGLRNPDQWSGNWFGPARGGWARAMHLMGIEGVEVRNTESQTFATGRGWWELALVEDGEVLHHSIDKEPCAVLMLTWAEKTGPRGVDVRTFEMLIEGGWTGPIVLGGNPRLFKAESLQRIFAKHSSSQGDVASGSVGTSLSEQADAIARWSKEQMNSLGGQDWIVIQLAD